MKTDYKIGDKLYCKNTLKNMSPTYFIENKTYKITEIKDYYDNKIIINIDSEEKVDISFNLLIPNNDGFKLFDHFLTKQEYRKQKLLKLNTTR